MLRLIGAIVSENHSILLIFLIKCKRFKKIISIFAQILQNVGLFGGMPVSVFSGIC